MLAAQRSLHKLCTESGGIIDQSTFVHDGKEIRFVRTSCPGIANYTSPVLAGRQNFEWCTDGDCVPSCYNFTETEQPLIADCEVLTNFFVTVVEDPPFFHVPAHSSAGYEYSTCVYSFLNSDSVPYDVCYSDFGTSSFNTANECFGNYPAAGSTRGAFCAAPPIEGGNPWYLEIYYAGP
ncbi:hypothetical protein FA95DRAFT_1577633 [Auriscalpium vulgare]|uniref:Uncharacterized protein n=1 Tax=Auriscalpium vulgare TaxID=40419 RepID=A0ACB8R734_9AGAM|nr:hypothetical protein FA95DRAFT_1577633 [Auriscalpium vulgare]